MRGLFYFLLTLMVFTINKLRADEVIPASSDDIDKIGDMMSRQIERRNAQANQINRNNFGALVSKEAKALKNSEGKVQGVFGDWASSQRRQDDKHHYDDGIENHGPGTGSVQNQSGNDQDVGQVGASTKKPDDSSGTLRSHRRR